MNQNKIGLFCSRKCYANFKKESMSGENNPRYSEKVNVICDNCGKAFQKIPSVAKIVNSEGKNHNFCCRECYYNFRKTYYIGEHHNNTGKKMSDSTKDKLRNSILQQYASGILNRETKPQIAINSILSKNHIAYTNEYIFKYYSVDNYLHENNLIIEVMGDYFHANPNLYPQYNLLNDMQKKDIYRDKRKHTYIKKYYNIEILYIWENEIKTHPSLCEKLILNYISNKGKLENYHSFNYSLENDQLVLKSNIINPYFTNPLTTKI